MDKLSVRKVLFHERPRERPSEGETRPPRLGVNLEFQAAIQHGTNKDGKEQRGVVTFNVKVHPDAKWQPYEIEVAISGAFAGVDVSEQQFDQFCRISVPSILFPYVRQLVHSVTADGNYGVVRIDPINLTDLAAKGEWISEPNASTAPLQPSEQLPSVAQK
jgi:preprotein translocase subunit SecB